MKVSILGLGSWALALGRALNDKGNDVLMWSKLEGEVTELNNKHTASTYFDNLVLESSIKATSSLKEVLDHANIVIIAVPTKFYRNVLKEMAGYLNCEKVIVNVSKGIEPGTFKLMSEVITEMIPSEYVNNIVNLSGPSHAEELILRKETTLVSASSDFNSASLIQEIFSMPYLRVYCSDDIIGTQLLGALKNIIALASGALAGMDKGDNAKAALLTRGLAEIKRYAMLRGAKETTVYGLAGLGDLIVTSSSPHSRNYQAGFRIGKGENPQLSVQNSVMVVEGIRTCKAVVEQLDSLDIEMPISQAIYDVFYNGLTLEQAIFKLMTRTVREEWGL